MHRFHAARPLVDGEEVTFAPEQAAKIARVLRLRPGDTVEVFDGVGSAADVQLTHVATRSVAGRLGAVRREVWPFALRPILYLALIRPQRFEWALEKAVELGAWRLQPLLTARTQHGGAEAGAARRARWRAITIEAAEQCGATFVPEVGAPIQFAAALALPVAARLLPHTADLPRERVTEALAAARPPGEAEVAVFIGPEGGFAPEEIAAAHAAGCRTVTLGPLTLRSETAALAVLAALASYPHTLPAPKVNERRTD
jgi:16S rRNA (uracil1498-N3)-methyltransferase